MELFEPYQVEPYSDFSQKGVQDAYKEALETVRGQLGQDYPLVIGGEGVTTTHGWLESVNPCNTEQVVGCSAKAGRKEVERVMNAAWTAYESWSQLPMSTRARDTRQARCSAAPPQI